MQRLTQLRQRSLARGNLLVAGGLVVAVPLSRYPHLRASLWMLLPVMMTLAGTVDTVRCIQRRWSLYHAGVLLCIYMDMMAISFVLFLFLYPYFLWITHQ